LDEDVTMKKTLTSTVVLTFAVVLSIALGIGSPAQAMGGNKQTTILDTLATTRGTEILLAAIQVVDIAAVCPIQIAELLDDKKAELVLLAPSNEAFEVFLHLTPGTLRTFDVDTVARILPGLLDENALAIPDLCDLLLSHIAEDRGEKKKGGKKDDPIPLNQLLEQGSIVMLDGSEYPVAIGGGRGGDVCFNFDSCVTERDVQTQNGVIHYLHKVLEEPPAEEQDPPPLPEDSQPPPSDPIDVWCSRSACAEDAELKAECVEFMNTCLLSADKEGDIEGCWASGLFKCSEREGLFGGDGLFDDDGIFD
jgi:uncharacterized surface protein with fasciclin (FAS1) repeats